MNLATPHLHVDGESLSPKVEVELYHPALPAAHLLSVHDVEDRLDRPERKDGGQSRRDAGR